MHKSDATNNDDNKCNIEILTIVVLEKFLCGAIEYCENAPKEIKKGANASKECTTEEINNSTKSNE